MNWCPLSVVIAVRSVLPAMMLAAVNAAAGQWADPLVLQPTEGFQALRTVPLPGARAAVVHDQTAQLIVGHHPGNDGRQLSSFPLSEDGAFPAEPLRIQLPSAPETAGMEVYPLALTLHPRLPLLYVLTDAVLPPGENGVAAQSHIDRLHVFLVRAGGLTLLRSTGAGVPINWEQPIGLMAVDGAGRRLFLPHLNDAGPVIGYVPLDPRGMPRYGENGAWKIETLTVRPLRSYPSGHGYIPGDDDAVIVPAPNGAATWDLLNRRAQLVHFVMPGAPNVVTIGGRPGDSSFYIAGHNSSFMARMAQSRGYLTLLPQIARIGGEASLRGPPLPMTGAGRLAVGDRNGVYVFELDEDGRFSGRAGFEPLAPSERRVMAWSEKMQQLYVFIP